MQRGQFPHGLFSFLRQIVFLQKFLNLHREIQRMFLSAIFVHPDPASELTIGYSYNERCLYRAL